MALGKCLQKRAQIQLFSVTKPSRQPCVATFGKDFLDPRPGSSGLGVQRSVAETVVVEGHCADHVQDRVSWSTYGQVSGYTDSLDP